jgi:hypothetical protein
MAVGAWQVYGNAIEKIADSTIELEVASRLRMILVTSSYTPSVDADDTYSDLSANEVANGGGYTTFGKVLTATVSRSTGTVTVDCDDQSWTSSTITAKYAVIVHDANSDGTLAAGDLLVAYSNLETGGGSISTTSGTFAVNINASGVFTLARAA